MAGRGRPTKPYRPTFGGGDIPGLTRKADGRWEIRSRNIRFTEHDEAKAIAKAKQLLGIVDATVAGTVQVYKARTDEDRLQTAAAAHDAILRRYAAAAAGNAGQPDVQIDQDGAVIVTDAALRPEQWTWLATQLDDRPKWVAQQLGRSDLIITPAGKPMTIDRLLKSYRQHSGAMDKAKQEATKPLERLAAHASATLLMT